MGPRMLDGTQKALAALSNQGSGGCCLAIGGSIWESNPAVEGSPRHIGFEDRAGHQDQIYSHMQ